MRRPPQGRPRVWVEKRSIDYDVTIEKVGAGISELIILISHLIDSRDSIFFLDSFEIHLHPHAQRKFLQLLNDYSGNNQFILATHSPLFIKPDLIANLTIIRETRGKSTVHQLKPNFFSSEEKWKLQRDLAPKLQEIFFCDLAILTEGPTEIGSIPVLARHAGIDFDENNISIVNNAAKHFDLTIKVCRGFNIPYLVLCDRDAIMDIEGSLRRGGKQIYYSPITRVLLANTGLTKEERNHIANARVTEKKNGQKEYERGMFRNLKEIALTHSIYVLSSKFETVLKKAGYTKYFTEIEKKGIRSKPLKGRYVAEKIVENSEPLPAQLEEFIEEIRSRLPLPSARRIA